jgi:protein-tyrosine phosphatase
MAEAIFRDMMPDDWNERVNVSSAGTAAWDGQPASRLGVEVLRDEGIDLSHHRARMLTREMIEGADIIVTMEIRHREMIGTIAPGIDTPVIVLGELDRDRSSPDIDDPIGGDRAVYEQTRRELRDLLTRLIAYSAEILDLEI